MTTKHGNVQQPRHEVTVPKLYLTLLNQVYEIERKTSGLEGFEKIHRNIERMKDVFHSEISPDTEIYYEDPMGQTFDDTRNDLEAHIIGESTDGLVVVDVIKPIIRVRGKKQMSSSLVVQRGIVSVEGISTDKGEKDE